MVLKEETFKSRRVKRICKWCGVEFFIIPSLAKRGNGLFCSRNCYIEWLKSNSSGESNKNWKGGKLKKRCLYCKKEFFAKRSEIKKGDAKFCSRLCFSNYLSKNRAGKQSPFWKGGKIKKRCEICNKEFLITASVDRRGIGQFCSSECYGFWRANTINGKNNPAWRGGKVKQTCKQCGREFFVFPSVINRGFGEFCSKSCSRKAQRMPTHHTKPEYMFEEICNNNNLPFKYTGDGSFWIHNINPDFIECNGKKVVIEIFGDYWHSPLLNRNLKKHRTLSYRKKILKRYGWKLIVFWESDLNREDAEKFVLIELKKYGIIQKH